MIFLIATWLYVCGDPLADYQKICQGYSVIDKMPAGPMSMEYCLAAAARMQADPDNQRYSMDQFSHIHKTTFKCKVL